jgi:hypothetical protein
VITLTTVRDKDNKVYSVNAFCWQRAMKGPTVSGHTRRGVIKGTASFSSPSEASVVWRILGQRKQTWQVSLKCKAQTQVRE